MLEDATTRGQRAAISAGGALKVDGSAVTQPVSGTFWQATQPVSGTVTANAGTGTFTISGAVTNTVLSVVGGGTEATAQRVTIANDSTGVLSVDDNGGSLTVDNGGTFAVQAAQSGAWNITNISGTVSLPTGAATAAKQPALGTAGTASTDVLSVQGIASMTALKVDGSAVTQPVSGTFWQATQPVSGTFWQATQPVSGTVTANAGTGTFTISGAVTNTVLSVVGGGTEATAQRVTIATDSTGVLSVDDNGGSLTVDGTVAATQSGTWSVRNQDGSGNSLTSHLARPSRGLDGSVNDGSVNPRTSLCG